MTPSTLGRRIWLALSVLGAVAVVILSWMVPEPESPEPAEVPKIDNISHSRISHSQWVPPEVVNPALTYGGR